MKEENQREVEKRAKNRDGKDEMKKERKASKKVWILEAKER